MECDKCLVDLLLNSGLSTDRFCPACGWSVNGLWLLTEQWMIKLWLISRGALASLWLVCSQSVDGVWLMRGWDVVALWLSFSGSVIYFGVHAS